MPKPGKKEKRSDYMQRCVQQLKQENSSMPTKECLAKCYGMWEQAHPGELANKAETMMGRDAKKMMKA